MRYWTTIYRLSCVLFGVLTLLALILIFAPRWNRINTLQQKRETLEQENTRMEEEISGLIISQQRFRTDPEFVEQTARDIGMVKSNEIVFKFVEEESTGP